MLKEFRISFLLSCTIFLFKLLNLSDAILTKSYITYLYNTYRDEINDNKQRFQELCRDNKDMRIDNIFAEITYMQLRELKVSSALEVAIGDEYGYVTAWILLALKANNNKNSILWTISHNDSLSLLNIAEFNRKNTNHEVNWMLTDINEMNGVQLSTLFSKKYNATNQLDTVIFSSHLSSDFNELFIQDLIDPYISIRDPKLPAVGLFFYTHEVPGVANSSFSQNNRRKRRKLMISEQFSRDRNKNVDTSAMKQRSLMVEYVEQMKSFKPVDINLFSTKSIKV